MTIQSIIARLEAGESGRELDVAIAVNVMGFRDIFGDGTLFDRGNDGYWSTYEDDHKNRPLPHYTTLLDAALSLVPGGWTVGSFCQDDNKKWWAELREGHQTSFNRSETASRCATPAIALCIAALKARWVA